MNGLILGAAMVIASSQQITTNAMVNDEVTASKFAIKAASVAGGARNCKFDKDLVDEYISLAQARITTLAKDKEETVLAKMDFTNSLLVAAIKPPKEGCREFNHKFLTALHDLS